MSTNFAEVIPLSGRTRRAPRITTDRAAGKPASKTSRPTAIEPAGVPLEQILSSWNLALEEAGKSERTIEAYVGSASNLLAYLTQHGLPTDTEGVTNVHIRAFLKAELDRTSGVSAHKKYRALNVFWKWVIAEEERTSPTPMTNVEAPKTTTKVKPPLREQELAALLEVCKGSDFISRRDTAIIRVLIDNGMRVSGLAGLRYVPDDPERNDVWISRHVLRIVLKGGNEHQAPIGKRAAAALDRYLRSRATQRAAAEHDWLWLGSKGRLTASGIAQMLERRGEEAGIEGKVHPHRFRRTAAHMWLEHGGDAHDLMQVAGWKSINMVMHYAAEQAGERARSVHKRISPGDRV